MSFTSSYGVHARPPSNGTRKSALFALLMDFGARLREDLNPLMIA